MYAEFIACFEATGQAIWLKKFVPDLKVVDCIHKPLKMYCDNQPVVFYAHNNKSSNAAKTIEIRYYVVKDKIQDQTISLEHIRTKDMLADPLTKGLPPNVFKEHLAGMGLRESLMIPGYAQKEQNLFLNITYVVAVLFYRQLSCDDETCSMYQYVMKQIN